MIEIKYYKIVKSTQDLAKKYIKSGNKKIVAFFAEGQTAGYGKQGRFFYSPKSTGIYFSLAIPGFEVKNNINLLTPALVTGIVLILKGEFPSKKFEIKWVNDVYLDRKKVGGILTENMQEGIVVGVGLNLNTEFFPDELSSKATRITKVAVDSKRRTELGNMLIEACLSATETYSTGEFLSRYREFCNLFGKTIKLQLGKKVIIGKVVAIDDEAQLVINVDNGERHFSSGEVTKVII